jgi:S1-C subfamily serine protease
LPRYGLNVVPLGDALLIIGLTAGGAAERAGLRVNDTILAVDNVAVTAANAEQSINRLLISQASVRLTIGRGNRRLLVRLQPLATPTPTLEPTRPPTRQPTALPITATSAAPGRPTAAPTQPRAATPIAPRVQLGVTYDVITPELARLRRLPVEFGALVVAVGDNTPASVVGIQPGDIILAVNGDVIDAKRTLAIRMLAYGPGDVVRLTILRDNDTIELRVTLVQYRGTAMLPGQS